LPTVQDRLRGGRHQQGLSSNTPDLDGQTGENALNEAAARRLCRCAAWFIGFMGCALFIVVYCRWRGWFMGFIAALRRLLSL
jgi:hypothetical protein